MRTRIVGVAGACIATLMCVPAAMAGTSADALAECLADNTTGKERKTLAKWVFSAIAAHPDMQDLSKAVPSTRDQIDRNIAEIVTKLLTESCREQTRAAAQQEGSQALQIAFSSLGQLAMQELMSNEGVKTTLTRFEQYLDKKKFSDSFGEQ